MSRSGWCRKAMVAGALALAGVAAPASAAARALAPRDYPVPIQFAVESRAWIPFAHVVDPLRLLAIPYAVNFEGNCYSPPWYLKPITVVTSAYRGDDHTGYDGAYRVSSLVNFAWDGTSIGGFSASGSYGTTHRDLIYARLPLTILNTCLIQQATASTATSGSGSGSSFQLGYSSKNPLTPGFATPAIDSSVSGQLAPDGTLTVNYSEDQFPSHGIRVTVNGTTAVTNTVGDASCLSRYAVVGPEGATLIAWGLTHQDNSGSFTVSPTDSGRVLSSRSPLCSLPLVGVLVSGGGAGASDQAAAASAPSISIAPLLGGVPGPPQPLAEADASGLVSSVVTDRGTLVVANSQRPVRLIVSGSQVVLRAYRVDGGQPGPSSSYGPYNGTLALDAAGSLTVTGAGGRTLAPARHGAPRTRAAVHGRGRRVTVRFRVRGPAAVAYTVAFVGRHRLRVHHGRVRVGRGELRRLRFFSVDVLGNVERAHGLSRGQLRRALAGTRGGAA